MTHMMFDIKYNVHHEVIQPKCRKKHQQNIELLIASFIVFASFYIS